MTDVLEQELARLVRLQAVGGPRGRLARRPPRLIVRAATREKHLHGYAHYDRHEIVVVLYPETDLATARATLMHEIVHLAGFHRHDRAFKHTLVNAAAEAWDIDASAYEDRRYKVLDGAIEYELRWRPILVWVRWAWTTSTKWTRVQGRVVRSPRSAQGAGGAAIRDDCSRESRR